MLIKFELNLEKIECAEEMVLEIQEINKKRFGQTSK